MSADGEVSALSLYADTITANNSITTGDLIVSGDFTVSGTMTTVNSSSLNVTDPMIYLSQDNTSNVVDLGIVGSFTESGTYQHTGLVRDASDGKWKLFSGVTSEPGSTINFSSYSKDGLEVGGLEIGRAHV